MPRQRDTSARAGLRAYGRQWIDAFGEKRLLTYASAIALQAFAGFVALTLLAIALVGVANEEKIWRAHIGPAIKAKVTQPTFSALDAAVEKIFHGDSLGLIVFASLLAIWEVSGSLRAVMDALNRIIDEQENRATLHRYALSVALALVVIVCIAAALFVVAVADKLLGSSGGLWHWLISVLRWPAGAVFLGLAVGVVARLGPTEHRGARWASAGAAMIVVAWLIESAIFSWFVARVANYRTASGNLLLFLAVTSYLYISAIVFLVGAQLDEFLRREAQGDRNVGIHELARRIF